MKIPYFVKALLTIPLWIPLVLLAVYMGVFGAILGYGFGATFTVVVDSITKGLVNMTDAREDYL